MSVNGTDRVGGFFRKKPVTQGSQTKNTGEIESLYSERESLVQSKTDATTKMAQLRTQQSPEDSELSQNIESITEQLNTAQASYSEAVSTVSSLSTSATSANAEALSLEAQASAASANASSLAAKAAATPKTKKQEDGVDEDGKPKYKEVPNPEYEAAQAAAEQAEAEAKALQQQADEAKQRADEAQAELQTAQQTMQEAQTAVQELQSQLAEIQSADDDPTQSEEESTEIQALQEEIDKFDSQIAELDAKIESLKNYDISNCEVDDKQTSTTYTDDEGSSVVASALKDGGKIETISKKDGTTVQKITKPDGSVVQVIKKEGSPVEVHTYTSPETAQKNDIAEKEKADKEAKLKADEAKDEKEVQEDKKAEEEKKADETQEQEEAKTNDECLVDPIGLEKDGNKYDFIVDDGDFSDAKDFLGSEDGLKALQEIAGDDKIVTAEELKNANPPIMVVATSSGGSQKKITIDEMMGELGIDDFEINLNDTDIDSNNNPNLNVTASKDGKSVDGITGYSTFKSADDLNKEYNYDIDNQTDEQTNADGTVDKDTIDRTKVDRNATVKASDGTYLDVDVAYDKNKAGQLVDGKILEQGEEYYSQASDWTKAQLANFYGAADSEGNVNTEKLFNSCQQLVALNSTVADDGTLSGGLYDKMKELKSDCISDELTGNFNAAYDSALQACGGFDGLVNKLGLDSTGIENQEDFKKALLENSLIFDVNDKQILSDWNENDSLKPLVTSMQSIYNESVCRAIAEISYDGQLGNDYIKLSDSSSPASDSEAETQTDETQDEQTIEVTDQNIPQNLNASPDNTFGMVTGKSENGVFENFAVAGLTGLTCSEADYRRFVNSDDQILHLTDKDGNNITVQKNDKGGYTAIQSYKLEDGREITVTSVYDSETNTVIKSTSVYDESNKGDTEDANSKLTLKETVQYNDDGTVKDFEIRQYDNDDEKTAKVTTKDGSYLVKTKGEKELYYDIRGIYQFSGADAKEKALRGSKLVEAYEESGILNMTSSQQLVLNEKAILPIDKALKNIDTNPGQDVTNPPSKSEINAMFTLDKENSADIYQAMEYYDAIIASEANNLTSLQKDELKAFSEFISNGFSFGSKGGDVKGFVETFKAICDKNGVKLDENAEMSENGYSAGFNYNVVVSNEPYMEETRSTYTTEYRERNDLREQLDNIPQVHSLFAGTDKEKLNDVIKQLSSGNSYEFNYGNTSYVLEYENGNVKLKSKTEEQQSPDKVEESSSTDKTAETASDSQNEVEGEEKSSQTSGTELSGKLKDFLDLNANSFTMTDEQKAAAIETLNSGQEYSFEYNGITYKISLDENGEVSIIS